MKRCPGCGETKPLDQFYRNRAKRDGYHDYCVPCWRMKQKNWRASDPERYARYASGRDRHGPENNKWRIDRKDAEKAHNAVARAVRSGKLVRPSQCEECSQEKRIEAHHMDYERWLEVTWLCVDCHRAKHIKEYVPL